jgi:hypothetical protein
MATLLAILGFLLTLFKGSFSAALALPGFLYSLFKDFKALLSAVGFIALAFYNVTQGQWVTAFQSLLGALAAFGLHSAINPAPAPASGK